MGCVTSFSGVSRCRNSAMQACSPNCLAYATKGYWMGVRFCTSWQNTSLRVEYALPTSPSPWEPITDRERV
eukprot:326005-Pyramimonas_sp.AAC.2